mmetsp:Transcript_11305/g.30549  ORF Transcript_11305/g.30549 Transcript_11305/m.30549 type:complete len:1050 (-) Transcript_11305:583-3732(-)
MAFWSYHGAGGITSTIDTILDKDEFSLGELLADEELLQECKAMNSRLITYLASADVIGQLFTYVLEEPEPDAPHDRCYTFPYISSEVLSCDVNQISEAIFAPESTDHFRRLLGYAQAPAPLNPVLAGYYAKVMSTLFKRGADQLLTALDAHFEGGRKAYVSALVDHLDMQSISDLVQTLVTPLDTLNAPPPPPPMLLGNSRGDTQRRVAGQTEGENQIESWLDPVDFATSVLAKARASPSAELHSLAADLFTHLIAQFGWGVLVSDARFVGALLDACVDARLQSVRSCAMSTALELLKLFEKERDIGGDEAAAKRAEDMQPLLDALGGRIENFVAMLNIEPELAPHLTPFLRDGGIPDCLLVTPVGSARLKLYSLLALGLPLLPEEAQLALAQCRLFEIALDAFERYATNNMLHSQVTSMVTYALREGAPRALTASLVHDASLPGRLAALASPFGEGGDVDAEDNLDGLMPGQPTPRRAPWMGHVIVMSNALLACAERDPEVLAALSETPQWTQFAEGALSAANVNERKTLGGQAPLRNDMDDSDEDELFSSKELDLDSMAAALAKHQSAARASAAETSAGADAEDEDAGDRDEMHRRFGQYMEQKGFLHELDGGLAAISREQDALEATQQQQQARWDADFDNENDQDDDKAWHAPTSFDTRQRDFFSSTSTDGDGGLDSHGGGDKGGSFDAVFGDSGSMDGAAPFEADFGELTADASAQLAVIGDQSSRGDSASPGGAPNVTQPTFDAFGMEAASDGAHPAVAPGPAEPFAAAFGDDIDDAQPSPEPATASAPPEGSAPAAAPWGEEAVEFAAFEAMPASPNPAVPVAAAAGDDGASGDFAASEYAGAASATPEPSAPAASVLPKASVVAADDYDAFASAAEPGAAPPPPPAAAAGDDGFAAFDSAEADPTSAASPSAGAVGGVEASSDDDFAAFESSPVHASATPEGTDMSTLQELVSPSQEDPFADFGSSDTSSPAQRAPDEGEDMLALPPAGPDDSASAAATGDDSDWAGGFESAAAPSIGGEGEAPVGEEGGKADMATGDFDDL